MDISEEVLDGIRELVTIGVGYSAGMLSELTKAHVTLTVPEIQIFEQISDGILNSTDLGMKPEETSQVFLSFSGECTGSLSLIIPNMSAINLVILLTGEDGSPDEMDALRVETLLEVGNVIISSVMSSFSILYSSHLSFLFPSYQTGTGKMASHPFDSKSEIGILARTRFQVQNKEIEGFLLFLLTRASFERFEESIHHLMERGL
jgi:chemotaxis protein CheC